MRFCKTRPAWTTASLLHLQRRPGHPAGNQVKQKTPALAITTYSWDYENRQTRVIDMTAVRTTYTWTAASQRTVKTTPTETVKVLWDGQNVVQEYDGSATTQAEYTLAPQPQPQPYGDLVSERRSSASSFYHFDALGSTQALSDSSQVVTDQYTYEAFGKVAASSGTTRNPYTWVGEKGYYADSESGLYSLRRREYEPGTGRFLSEDPARSEANLYRYAGNNPATRSDPSGLESPAPTGTISIMQPSGTTVIDGVSYNVFYINYYETTWWGGYLWPGGGTTLVSTSPRIVIPIPAPTSNDAIISDYLNLQGQLRVLPRQVTLALHNFGGQSYYYGAMLIGAISLGVSLTVPGIDDLVLEAVLASKLAQQGMRLVLDAVGAPKLMKIAADGTLTPVAGDAKKIVQQNIDDITKSVRNAPDPQKLLNYPVSPKTGSALPSTATIPIPAPITKDMQTALTACKNNTGAPWQGKWGFPHKNRERFLPEIDPTGTAITYKEYYLPKTVGDWGAGTNRLVIGSDGQVYLSTTHYGKTGNPPFVYIGHIDILF